MFWILRRTGAVNFFNSLNNNCASKSNFNHNNNNEKNIKRPERKAYGRLSMDSDDAISTTKNIMDDGNTDNNFHLNNSKKCHNNCNNNNDNCNNNNNQYTENNNSTFQLNQINGNNTEYQQQQNQQQPRLPYEIQNAENRLNRLQAIAMSDDEDYDESLTCNVCDRAFHCHRQLASHQQKKRLFVCSGCDSLFSSLMLLEHHKEEFEHWSDDEENRRPCCRRNRGDDFTDTDSFTSEAESEDLERLL
ncbi:homeobox protein 2-like [Condylostylus longicornis]|uniref:homeobox protein 2-like n=1 Tax=Condylostylus longicornis TaxID=2530218 RepID=UPI00244E0D7B|nr:homeobox protein 2-like [Condylostylus longicornis]